MSRRQEQDKNIAKAFEGLAQSGGRRFDLMFSHQSLGFGEMASILEALPRDLDCLTLRGKIEGEEIADLLPPTLRELHLLHHANSDVPAIKLPPTLKILEIEGLGIVTSSAGQDDWIARLPEGLEEIFLNYTTWKPSEFKALADKLGPNLTTFWFGDPNNGVSGIEAVADRLEGRSGWLSDALDPLVPHKNILYFYSMDDKSMQGVQPLCDENAKCAQRLFVKAWGDCLLEEDVREAAQRLPSIVAIAENKTWALNRGIGRTEEEILTALSNLAKAARQYDIPLPIPVKYQDRIAPVPSRTPTVPVAKSWCRKAPMKYPVQALDALGLPGSLATLATGFLLLKIAFSSGTDVSLAPENVTPLRLPQVATKPVDIQMNRNGDIDVNLRPEENQKVNINVHPPIKR